MPAFFVTREQIQGDRITITGELLQHLRDSLRFRIGDELLLTEESHQRHRVTVIEVTRSQITGTIVHSEHAPSPTPTRVHLAQALIKHDQMDWVVQKGTELGMASLQPLVTRHAVVRPDAARTATQRQRWQRIAREAAQQCERWDCPLILEPQDLRQWLASFPKSGRCVLLQERSQTARLSEALRDNASGDLTIVIGPEGGWTEEEVVQCQQAGISPVSMGPAILRAETAAIAALTIVQSRLGTLG